jgi:hypothetical protein
LHRVRKLRLALFHHGIVIGSQFGAPSAPTNEADGVSKAALIKLLWISAVALLGAGGVVVLHACDLAIFPLYGRKFCAAPRSEALARERTRNALLLARLREAELTFAQKPVCRPPPPAPAPELPQGDQPPEQKKAPPAPKQQETLRVPDRLEDLRGCWQTIRGDQRFVTDDEEQRPVGPTVRICFCFGDNGHGTIKLLYADGVKCRAPLKARIDRRQLNFRHPAVDCHRGDDYGVVAGEVICENRDESGAARCLTHNLGRMRSDSTDQYRRVEPDYCR